MEKHQNILLEKFISGKRISDNEFQILDDLFNDPNNESEVSRWLESKWQDCTPENVDLKFEEIRKRISLKPAKYRLKRVISILSKTAAILFIPLFIVSIYLYIDRSSSSQMLALTTQKGEQTSVILPDGTKVWLNVDTKLRYPADYGVKNRNVELEGEALFEVVKNKKLPFEVFSEGVRTRALGTCFTISAYPGAAIVKSSLIEGSVEVKCRNAIEILKPGQQLVYKKYKSGVIVQLFSETDELAWKNEQLIFRFTPFDQVLQVLGKWYDINFEYDPALFKRETFTAKFARNETLEHVLHVMARAGEFEYKIENQNVVIEK